MVFTKISKFPRNYRYTLRTRIENHLYDLMEKYINTRFSKKKTQLLIKANIDLEILRYYVRLCKEVNLITIKHYEYLAKSINEIGRQTGGWYKESLKTK